MIDAIVNLQLQAAIMELMMRILEKYESVSPVEGEVAQDAGVQKEYGSFSELIQQMSQKYGVDSDLVDAVIRVESNYNPDAESYAGAQGLMQLMPATARSLGVQDSFDPTQNVDGGVRLLRQLLNRYDGNLRLTLAAYNAGPGAVAQYGGVPPYQETQTYVSRVLSILQ